MTTNKELNEKDELKFHPVADLFPMLDEVGFKELVCDVKENGLHDPIWRHHENGTIIDGRNRYLACLEAGVTPKFRYWDGKGSLTSFAISVNLKRRHLSESQRAMIAVKIKPMFEQEAKQRQGARTDVQENLPEGTFGQSRDKAAKTLGISGRTVTSAEKVINKGVSDLVKAVEEGKVSVSSAASACNLPKEKQGELVNMVNEGEAKNLKAAQSILFSSKRNDNETSDYIFAMLNKEFSFKLDVCAHKKNYKIKPFLSLEGDGLKAEWSSMNWLNPPYGHETKKWVKRAFKEGEKGNVTVCLLASRTGNDWFHKYCLKASEIRFIKGRLKFKGEDKNNSATVDSIIVVFGRGNDTVFKSADVNPKNEE